ncbi:heavy metal translocating P-type ATPase [Pseudodesulfovibrio sp. JC047]|uniref:heavy metal translocating P-type ATPase n=1 Tax=Pseudodesulfovibrio sp. JC047 TaxID=2683199 RepID=UPI0013D73A94|nr:heavy metal translocating P-type ATPase [Pseudodesulfovibrio sp. JC047]NDV18417.1 heavy metal translocating P-type ATPase [Pseudodesulfovibrio sp. JC047]
MTAKAEPHTRAFTIAHEVRKRIRLRSQRLFDPALDLKYLEALVESLPGVESSRTNKWGSSIVIEYDGNRTNRDRILNLLENIPVDAYMPDGMKADPISLPTVVAQGAAAALTPFMPPQAAAPTSWLMGLPTMLEGLHSLLYDGVKVEVLDASAVAFSLLRRDYFTANAIVAMLGLGSAMENWTEKKSNDLLKNLLRPQVEMVWVERDAQEKQVNFTDLMVGDLVICGSGELVPVDGVVVDGDAALNQSSITGESLPVHVSTGDDVLSGAVVEDGRIKISANNVGNETSMARIGRFLENSLRTQSTSQKKSDELADKLVPVTFALGLGLFAMTHDVTRAASVLTVDYSCAIKLASPVAVKTGMHTAGHCGVLLKGAQALDNLAHIDTIVFDKTGTLTKGNLTVADVLPHGTMHPNELLALAAGAEEHYSHPVARAVVAEAKAQNLQLPPISQVDFIVAHGVSAHVEGEHILVGSRHFLEDDEGVDCSGAEAQGRALRAQGKSLLYVARSGHLAGIITLRDELRPEASETLAMLKKRGIHKIVMLTGDHKDTAQSIAADLGCIDEVHWELNPEDKAVLIKELQENGHILAFAGDGVNDAPALVSADVGICMPGGADLARETAQVVLLENDLRILAVARDVATQTQRILKRTFQAAVGINSAVLLAATAGTLSPVASAFLHNASTLGILGYAAAAGRKIPVSAQQLDSTATFHKA